jgi:hypothetical protein
MFRRQAALLALLAGCGSPSPADAPSKRGVDPAIEPAPAPPVAARPAPAEAVVARPVYGEQVPEIPQVRALCEALHVLPEERRGACCRSSSDPRARELADACTQSFSAALSAGGVILRDDVTDACITALHVATTGCDWVGPQRPPLPEVCAGVVLGTLGAGARCRSHLECAAGLRCAGVCAPPAADGDACDPVVDVLAAYLPVDLDGAHPPCRGRCVDGRCRAGVAAGGACTRQLECAAGLHCDGATCVDGALAAAGAACADAGCAAGSACLDHVCVARRPAGAACTRDLECAGACLRDGDGPGACGPGCGAK